MTARRAARGREAARTTLDGPHPLTEGPAMTRTRRTLLAFLAALLALTGVVVSAPAAAAADTRIRYAGTTLEGQTLPAAVAPVSLHTRYAMSASRVLVDGALVPSVQATSVKHGTNDYSTVIDVDLSAVPTGPHTLTFRVTTSGTSDLTATAFVGYAEQRPILAHAPPVLTNPITLDATDADASFALTPGQDYIVRLPGSVGHPQTTPLRTRGGLTLSGGDDVVVIGGTIRHDVDYLAGTTGKRGISNRAIFAGGWTGTLFIEGVLIGGEWLFEGINLDTKGPAARAVIQNVVIEDPVLALGGGGGHEGGDPLQVTRGPAGGLDVDRFYAYTSSQGFFLQPRHFTDAWHVTPARVRLSNVYLEHWPTSERDWYNTNHFPDQGPEPTYTTYQHGAMLLMMGPLMAPGEGTGKAYHLTNVHLKPNPDRAPTWNIAHAVGPDTNTTAGVVKRVYWNPDGRREVAWDTTAASDRRIYGVAVEGPPPAPVVKAAWVGPNYTTPGYQP